MSPDENKMEKMELPKQEKELSEKQLEEVTGGNTSDCSSQMESCCPKCGSSNLAFLTLGTVCLDCGYSIIKGL